MEPIFMGIDHANYQMKTEHCVFKSGIKKNDNKPFGAQDVLLYNGDHYVVGLDNNNDLAQHKYENDNYFIMTLAAIAKEIESQKYSRTCDIVICAGLPIVPAQNPEERKKLAEYLKRGKVTFEFENIQYNINIKNAYVFAQGYCAVAPYFSQTLKRFIQDTGESEPDILGLDIGGWTTDAWLQKGGRTTIHPGSTYNLAGYGTNSLFAKCIAAIDGSFNFPISNSDIESVLVYDKPSKKISKDMQTVLYKTAYNHFTEMLNALSKLGFSKEHSNILFVGGGATILENVQDNYQHFGLKWSEVIQNSLYLNAQGYVWFAKGLLGIK